MGNTHNSNFEKSEISDLIKDIKITKIYLQNYSDKYHITQKQKEIKLEQIQNTNHIIQIKLLEGLIKYHKNIQKLCNLICSVLDEIMILVNSIENGLNDLNDDKTTVLTKFRYILNVFDDTSNKFHIEFKKNIYPRLVSINSKLKIIFESKVFENKYSSMLKTEEIVLSNPKRNSSDGQILDGFCRSSLGKPMSSIDDIGFQRILSSKEFLNGIDLHWTSPI